MKDRSENDSLAKPFNSTLERASIKTTHTGNDQKSTIQVPQISLPKGGGAIKGIGEKFAANPLTGAGFMTVPIAVSPRRSGFGPQLSLSYDSGSGNGPFGLGWNFSLPSIICKTKVYQNIWMDKRKILMKCPFHGLLTLCLNL